VLESWNEVREESLARKLELHCAASDDESANENFRSRRGATKGLLELTKESGYGRHAALHRLKGDLAARVLPTRLTAGRRVEHGRRLILLVPYRDRAENLAKFVLSLHAHLAGLDHEIVVIEQAGDEVFNKGRLFNAGFDLYRDRNAYFCFHDVDLLPENAACDYSYPRRPTHLSKFCSQFQYAASYPWACGGVILFRSDDFVAINGYSNDYWGWGGEDDDLAMRIAYVGLGIEHREGRYTSLPHERGWSQEKVPHGYRRNVERLRSNYAYEQDGLNNVPYRLLGVFEEPGYVRCLVDVGSCPPVTDDVRVSTSTPDSIDPLVFWRSRQRAPLALSIVKDALRKRQRE